MSSNGYIKLHRKIVHTSFYRDSLAVHLAMHLLVSAAHKPYKQVIGGEEVMVDRGSLITGRYALAKDLGADPYAIYRKMRMLSRIGFLHTKTNNKYSIVSICNYESYQSATASSAQQFAQQVHSKCTTDAQVVHTNKKDKKDKNTLTSDDLTFKEVVWPFWEYFKEKTGQKNLALLPHRKEIILRRLKDHKVEDLKAAVDNFSQDDWPDRNKFMELKYCIGVVRGVDNLDKWVNMTPKQPKDEGAWGR